MSLRNLIALLGLTLSPLSFVAVSRAQERPVVDSAAIAPSPFVASWVGALDVGAIRLRLVFHLKPAGETLLATLDSPDQGAKGIPLDEVSLDGSRIRLASAKMKAVFTGQLNADRDTIEGTWLQKGREFPLVLRRSEGAAERRRPQTPLPPYPYQVEELTFPHLTEQFQFAATLTIPAGEGRFPAAILVSGSGPQDRDESIGEHKPFAVLADHLTRSGMLVLRVDDRGVGGSQSDGNPADDTTVDFATDVRSALAYLRSRSEVDPARIGLIGHSEGALVGALVAAADDRLAFLVMLSGPGVPGDQMLALQTEKIARASGASESGIADLKALQGKIFSIIRNQPDIAAGKQEAREILLSEYARLSEAERKSAGSADAFVELHSSVIGIPWFRQFILLDPQAVLAKVACPVLALTGEKDLQVPPEQNLPGIEQGLARGPAQDVTLMVLPGLNHLLQTAETGLVTEYGEIEETISPTALDQLARWLKERNFIR